MIDCPEKVHEQRFIIGIYDIMPQSLMLSHLCASEERKQLESQTSFLKWTQVACAFLSLWDTITRRDGVLKATESGLGF